MKTPNFHIEHQDNVPIIAWDPETFSAPMGRESSGSAVCSHLDLTALHGEREFIRQLVVLPRTDGAGTMAVMRTNNEHRLRAIDLASGETLWVSPAVVSASEENPQVSQLGAGDIDGDGVVEVITASYRGDLFCVDSSNGSLKWHRRLPWCINNPRLDVKRALPGRGGHIALTVGNDFDWCAPSERPRINFVRHPRLILVDGGGEVVMDVPDYSAYNGCGHNVWMFDIDGDGCCELFCSGNQEILCYRGTGERLFALPCTGEAPTQQDTHPDDLKAFNLFPERPGLETVYLDGTDGIIIADSSGEIVLRKTFPSDLASHLQNITAVATAEGPRLIAENIRAADSKLLCLDTDLQVIWAAEMAGDMVGVQFCDWDGDGEPEIVTGSLGRDMFNRDGVETGTLQVMKLDGTPCYWHRWEGVITCVAYAALPNPAGPGEAIVVGVGNPNGPEGRFSLAVGGRMELCVMGSAGEPHAVSRNAVTRNSPESH